MQKKLLRFLRSMTFGMILLGLILLCSFPGSVIAQGNTPDWYVETYPDWHGVILKLGLDDVFDSWYFVMLLALLCLGGCAAPKPETQMINPMEKVDSFEDINAGNWMEVIVTILILITINICCHMVAREMFSSIEFSSPTFIVLNNVSKILFLKMNL